MMVQIPWLKKLNDEDTSFLDVSEKELLEDVYYATEEEVQLTVTEEDEDVEDLPDKIAIIEENLKLIIRRLKMSKEIQNCFMEEYPKWEQVRNKNTESLEAIGEYLHELRKNCNISRLIGNCTSLIGGGICVASVALTPLTIGMTTPLAIAGGSISVLGSATSVGASITEMAKLKNKIQEANRILEQDKESFVVLKLWLTHANDLSDALDNILAMDGEHRIEGIFKIMRDFVQSILSSESKIERNEMVKSLAKSAISKIPRELLHTTLTSNLVSLLLIIAILYNRNQKDFESASITLKVIANIVSLVDFSVDVLQSASNFIKSEIAIASNVSKSVTKAAVALFGMSLDMASIILTSIDVHKGSLSTEGQNITNTVEKLREESCILGKVYNELTGIR